MSVRDLVLSAKLPRERVSVPEWGGDVFVRVMTGLEREQFEAEHLRDPNKDFGARLTIATLCEEDGTPCFTPTDLPAVQSLASTALARIIPIAMRINALSKADVDELEKNSSAIPSDSTPSNSLSD